MEDFKFILISIIILASVGLLGYWAVSTLEPGDVYLSRQKEKELTERNQALLKEVADLKSKLASLEAEQAPVEETPEPTPEPTETTPLKHQSLINDLQKLITDKVFMKEKSKGSRVGTVQTFLNIYNKTSKKVDNDYGPGMKQDVMNFQKAEGITADGETGPNTYSKMIEWLKKQP